MTMLGSLIRFGRRHLHTIVSKEIIKPSLPTPSHLKTYNLSLFDQLMPSMFSPLVTFYPNTGIYDHSFHDQTLILKNSLSRALTKYYPFAGRHTMISPSYVDCNDHGAEFVEASINRTLSDFLDQSSHHEDIDQLFPYGRTFRDRDRLESDNTHVMPLAVQVSRFECGGVAIAVSLSHKIADGSSLIHFFSDWAKVTQDWLKQENYEVVAIEPQFISFEKTNINFSGSMEASNNCVTKSFLFSNTKINELKLKVIEMTTRSGQPITNPTRVEVLTWLLYKCALAAATKNNAGSFKPTCIRVTANLRGKMMESLPENSIGNFLKVMEVQTTNESELKPEFIIGELRKQKMAIRNLKNIEAAFAPLLNAFSGLNLNLRQIKFEDPYVCSSICGYDAYGIDFGWGSPLKVTLPGNLKRNSFLMMDASNKEGIEVLVCLKKQDMDFIERDIELQTTGTGALEIALPIHVPRLQFPSSSPSPHPPPGN